MQTQFTKFTSNITDNAIFDIQREEKLKLPNPCDSHLLNLWKQQCQIEGSHSGIAKVSSLLGCYTAITGT
jgi:hypothetical protein